MDSPKGKPPSQALRFQANPQPNVQANSGEGPAQAVGSVAPSRPVKFQAGPTPTYTLPSQAFTFQASPTLTYPKPALFSGPSAITSPPQPEETYAGYGKDLEKVHRLEGEVEDLKKRYSDVQHDVGLLTRQDEQDRGRSSQRRPPPVPRVDRKAEQQRLRREGDYKKAVAEKAHDDAKRVEVEVKRKDWWHKNKQHASPVHGFPVTPATTAEPVTSFTTALACRPSSSASASASQNSSSYLAVAPPITAPSPPSKIPPPNRSRSCSQSADRRAMEHPVRSRDRPALKGILVQRADGQTREPQTPLKFLRFNSSVKVAQIVDVQEDGDCGDRGQADEKK